MVIQYCRDRRKIIMLELYVLDEFTLQEIGDAYGLTRERVRQIIGGESLYKAARLIRKYRNKRRRRK